MKDEMMKKEMSSVGPQLLRLPLQAAPVERTLAAVPPVVGREGVVPSISLTDLVAKALPPMALNGWDPRTYLM
jgi:hypothetical protein